MKKIFHILLVLLSFQAVAQVKWTDDSKGYYTTEKNALVKTDFLTGNKTTVLESSWLIPKGKTEPLNLRSYAFSKDNSQVLIYTNTKRVWRYDTRGDYWILDLNTKNLRQLGKGRPESSLMFAKLSPDGKKVAYVSQNNIYVEDIKTGAIKALTTSKGKLINGTFDWVYEEEFGCRDGFSWSDDSKNIAYWQVDANTIRDFYMINTTDSIYSFTIPVEYPKVGETPSATRIGVVNVQTAKTVWMKIPGDSRNNYIPRMDWVPGTNQVMIQQLNRKHSHSKWFYADAVTGNANPFFEEKDDTWVEVHDYWGQGWKWLKGNQEFLLVSEKDGWRQLYRISKDGKKETKVTTGGFDLINPLSINEETGVVYFTASPNNATQAYLYKTKLDGSTAPELVTPANQEGTHSYQVSPNGAFAVHSFSNYFTVPMREDITLPDHKAIKEENSIAKKYDPSKKASSNMEFFKVKTAEGVEMDAWMVKPNNFDPSKKYPTVFYVYGEPAAQTVTDRFGAGRNGLYAGDMAADGYIYMSVDNRGTPGPKGRAWRKSIYRNIGLINIDDQANACKKIIETYPFVDASRIAVHGWSGGGSSTLNLLFKYPDLYQTGIAGAAVANQLTYDNIYQERYMGLPQENMEDFVQGSPVTHAKNLKGNLLYIHGTGDDNVHYQNAEMLINELIKHNRQFQIMPYPNRNHGIREAHLVTLFTNYLKTHCPPGAR